MKKILSILTLLVAFAVQGVAENYYVVGDLVGSWVYNPVSTGNALQMQLVGGSQTVYYADFTSLSGDKYFSLADGDGTSWDDFNGSHRYATGTNDDQVPTDGTSIQLEKSSCSMKITGDGSNYHFEFDSTDKTLKITKSGTAHNAEITSVQLIGSTDAFWTDESSKKFTLTATGVENEYSGVLDLSDVTTNYWFKLVVNDNNWIGWKALKLVDANNLLSAEHGNDGDNFVLSNSNSGYKTYTVTAKWNPSPAATAGWTMTIAAKDFRDAYIHGDMFGGWENGQLMTKQANGLYTYVLEGFSASATDYQYRMNTITGNDFSGYTLPMSGNLTWACAEAGTYNLTFTANVTGEAIGDVPAYTLKLDAEKVVVTNTYTATFDNAGNWDHVYAYTWTDGDPKVEQLGAWPGTEITKSGDVYSVSITAAEAPAKIIFHNNAGTQTEDFAFVDGQSYTYTAPETPTSYSIVGELTGGWHDNDTEDVEMTLQSSGLYTYEVASFTAEAKGYSYRLRANHKWGVFELPQSGNQVYTFTEAGNYKLTFTANVTGEEIDGIAGYTLTLNAERLPDPVVLPGTAIWENTTGVTPDWSGPFAEIASDKFADVNVGDIIHVAVQNVTAGERWSAQAVIFDGYGVQLEGGTPVGDGTQTVASYVVTGDMLALLKANGMRVGGNKYTTTKVSVESPVYTGSENSIWVGDLALAWTPQATVSKYHFINSKVKEGDVIKLSYESTGSPNIQILPDWGGSYGTVEYGDGFATLVVTAGNESVLMDKGLIVNADGITLKQIELLAENRVTEKNMTITDGRHILSNEFDQYPDDYKVVLSISNNNDPFVSVDGWGIGKGFYLDNWESATTDKMLDIAGKGGKTFEVIITVGDLKETAKNGGDSYIGNSNYPQGGVTFNIWSGCKLESAKVLIPVYYFITGENDAWTVGDEITAAEGVYSATAKGAGKLFAIARASSLNTAGDDVTDWKTIVRPVTTDGNFIVNFANYSDNTMSGEGKVWQIGATNDADVTINYTPADGKFAICCQTEVEITDGYATYSNAQMYTVKGATANFVTVNSELTEATLVPQAAGAVLPGCGVNTLATGKGIVLSGAGPATIKSVDLNATTVDVAGNMLTGTGDYTFNLNADKYTAYLLQTVNGQTGFQKWNGDTTTPLAAHKAFLAIPNVTAGAPAFISFGGGTTGIEAVTQSQRTGQYYTLDGRRVENPTKGLYIINGKKVVIK